MKNKLLIFCLILFTSCNVKSKIDEITPIIRFLSQHYNTNIVYDIGVNKTISFVKIKIQNNDFLNVYPSKKIPASYIAVYLLENLNDIFFNQIQIDFYQDDKLDFKISYKVDDLLKIIKKKSFLNTIKKQIINQNYQSLFENFSSDIKISENDKKLILNEFLNEDKDYGTPKKIEDHGYIFGSFKNNKKVVSYVGCISLIIRERNKTQIVLLIDDKNNSLVSIRLFWG